MSHPTSSIIPDSVFPFLSTVLEEAPNGIFAFDTEFRYVLWNRRMEDISGKSRDEVLGRSAFEAFPFLAKMGEAEHFKAALTGQSSETKSREYAFPGGRDQCFDVSYRPVHGPDGKVIGGIAHLHDCSDRIRAQEQLHQEAEVLDTLLRTAETVNSELDLEKVVQAATDAATQISGAQFGAFFYNVVNERGESYMLYTISGVPREAFAKFPMPRNTDVFAPTFRGDGVVRSGNIKKDPRYGRNAPRHGMPEGHLPVCSYLAVSVKSRTGDEVYGGLFFGHSEPDKFTEASERLVSAVARHAAVAIENARLYNSERRARAQAEESQARLSAIWNSMTDAFMAFDRDWRYLYVNDKAREFTQRSREDLLGHTLWEVFPEVIGTKLETALRSVANQHEPKHFEFQFSSQGTWFEFHAYPSGDGVSVYSRDITLEKHAKEEISKAEERLKLITTTTDVGTWYCDLPFDVLEWSLKTKEHFWLPPDATVTIDTFYQRLHPDDRERTRLAIEKSIQENGLYDVDYRTVSNEGKIKWIRAIGRTFYDHERKPIRFDGITVDQTDRRNAEEALRRSERLATAGRLAATVAHEVNNPLEAVTNLIYLCQTDPTATETICRHLKVADEELRRVAHIVRQTLGFYRETSAPQITNIAALVTGLLELYRKRYNDKQVVLSADLDHSITAVIVPGGIRQVIANLVSNALDACSAGDNVNVTVRRAGDEVEIVVADSGHGITSGNVPRLFEAFFTTKAEVGTGLGLWVSKEIVERHGGRMHLETNTDPLSHGTVFTVSLPLQGYSAVQVSA